MNKLNSKGFSLIELLVAVTILAIGLLAVAGLQATAIQGNTHGNTISQATTLAEDQLETIRNMAYDDIVFASNPYVENNVGGSIFTRETLIEVDTPMIDLKRVTVTVKWNTKRSHQVVLRTIVANGG
ncbi:MAG: prepilin-type N-terminal cleavage/methylation domain-containing protein [Desulfuromonadaceae bacterium]|jgi:type IV pilus assembly protein PilV